MWLYRFLLALLTPIICLKVRRFKKNYPAYRAKEAFGRWGKVEADLWIHCASVGEVLAARPLVTQWRKKYPNQTLLVTTMTPTGAAQVAQVFPFALHRYLPMDWRLAVRLALRHLTCPRLLIIETELWPNLLEQAKSQGLRISIVNARMSERSYQRYQKFSAISRHLFTLPDQFLAHAQADAQRFKGLGAKKVYVTGSIKFDLNVPEEVMQHQWRDDFDKDFVWVAASTHQGEDELMLQTHQALLEKQPKALLILVPRHPERFESVFALAQASFSRVGLRSQVAFNKWSEYDVIIGDSMGELMQYYQTADLAFVGGSLVKRGGHNPVEPALLAKAIIVGPHVFNFKDITDQLLLEKGALQCQDETQLTEFVLALASQASQRLRIGQSAQRFAEKSQGAVTRVLNEIDFH
ncbi:3-deoxy-D-manno-octulosonic acid transferase [Marinomonas posidonica]|uniref:3-deoxy-D-manno-octulosonic acid transferase n=1 Tax=Marinomonas posidonica (strain CECT 7376 / NCIMB 14433 / IVIA-Po-181) TaxID=491952 RepID=F6CS48_MARPP|nr:3-deoxy-D-manno-octulosonic acid transferase [Marinomonas posidonica]AEF53835.1 Three-deoxy-D-manno-octulosonic-acid transferase domain-containing protein [Marinomonas posidonica IVIA-Po-181]